MLVIKNRSHWRTFNSMWNATNGIQPIFTARNEVGARLCFYMCVWFCSRGACVVAGGHAWPPGACVIAGGHAWLLGGHVWLPRGACVVAGGMRGCWGVCVVVGGGMCGWRGDACVGYDEIRSMTGRYVSYWNAFLLHVRLHQDADQNVKCEQINANANVLTKPSSNLN